MGKNEDRKGKVVTFKLGEDRRKDIPTVFDTIHLLVKTPVCDDDNPDGDETLFLRTIRTVDVEGVTITRDGKGFNVNGEFDVDLEADRLDDNSPNRFWKDKDDAINAWEYLTNQEFERAEDNLKKAQSIFNAIKKSKDERQY